MKSILLSIFIFLNTVAYAQILYNPQTLYDAPGGFMDIDSLRSMEITFYNPNFDSYLDSVWQNDLGLRLPAQVQMSNGIYLDSVGIRYKGNSTYIATRSAGIPKYPLNIDINDIISEQTLMGYKKVKLANAFLDPTFAKEITAYNIYHKYLPSPEASLIDVTVQGDYKGLYVITESIDKQFLKKHFDESKGVLIKCDPVQGEFLTSSLEWLGSDTTLYFDHYEMKSDFGWTDFVNLIEVLNNNPDQLHTVLNIDRVLWAFAVNQAILNIDTYNLFYRHNYYMYQTKDGLFQMIPWDVSESFIGAGVGLSGGDLSVLYNNDPWSSMDNPNVPSVSTPLVSALIADPTSLYGKIYTAHLRTIIEESLIASDINDFVDSIQAVALQTSTPQPYRIWNTTQFFNNVDNLVFLPVPAAGIISTVNNRNTFFSSNSEFQKTPPSISNLSIQSINNDAYVTVQVTNANNVELLSTISEYNSFFAASTMNDDGTNGDEIAGDQIYTSYLPQQDDLIDVKFYIRANNDEAVKLEPQRAEYEFYVFNKNTKMNTDEVVINEFLASNDAVIADQEGEFDDWIELYNNSGSSIDLTGYFLSDDPDDLTKWEFPTGTFINGNDYLIIWADDDMAQAGIHANFKLSGGGESILLIDDMGNIVDEISFGNQTTDISHGRFPNGMGSFTDMQPTFNAENMITTSVEQENHNSILRVYPNPAQSYITVLGEFKLRPQAYEIYSIVGKLLTSGEINSDNQLIDLSRFGSNFYILKISNQNFKILKMD